MNPLPPDAITLPVAQGALLVSASHAVFCPVPADQLDPLQDLLAGRGTLAQLAPALRENLHHHGFFGPPRALPPSPPLVQLQLTNACNLHCNYCCTNSGPPRDQELTLADVQHVLREAKQLLGPDTRVALLGGEPLLVPWTLDAADFALDLGLHVTLFTNGMPLLDAAFAQRTAQAMARGMEVRISLAGPTADLCDGVSGAPRFDQVIAAIHQLASLGAKPCVDLMLLPDHVDPCGEALPALRKLLPQGVKISFGLAYLSGRESGQHIFPSRPALEDALDRIAFAAGEVIPAPKTSTTTQRRDGCACALGNHIHVRSDGALFTCFKMEERVGHLSDGFAQVLQGVMADPHPAYTLDTCKACPLVSLCGGGCRSDNFLYTADPNRPICDTWRVQVLAELLFEDNVAAIQWPAHHLLAEAHARNIPAPLDLPLARPSSHLGDAPCTPINAHLDTRDTP